MSNDRLRQIEVFCAVVDTGGFAAASLRIGVSQSAVSKALKALEDRLGVTLLNRTTRGQNLSIEGEKYLKDCRKALELIKSSEEVLISQNVELTGLLKVSVSASFGLDQISPIIPIFMKNNPSIKIELSVTDNFENFIDDQIDIAIRMGELEDSSLVGKRLCSLDRIIVSSPTYLKSHGEPKTPKELLKHNCLMWKSSRYNLNNWPFYEGKSLSVMHIQGNFHSNNGSALIAACLDGVGIMRMAEHVAIPLIRSGKLVQLLENYHQPDNQAIYIVFQREKQNLARVRKFLEFCVKVFQKPNWL